MITYTLNYDEICSKPNIKTKSYSTWNGEYQIICYEKGYVCFDDTDASLYRSVIMNTVTNQVCCFSPPKSLTMNHFLLDKRNTTAYGLDKTSNSEEYIPCEVIVNEIIEGSMINLWYDHTIQSWEISTKTSIGGNYVYYRSSLSDGADTSPEDLSMDETGFVGTKTFRQMFLEAISAIETMDVNDIFGQKDENHWPTNHSYSFVLQHPQNQLVLPVNQPRLYLIGVYELDGVNVKVIPSETYLTWDYLKQPWIYYPPTLSCTGLKYSELIQTYSTIQGSSDMVGVMCTNTVTGMRTKIINTVFNELKEIRGINTNLLYLFFTLQYIDKTDKFLNIFPWYSNLFTKYRKLIQKWVDNILISYKARYVKRTGEIISHRYMPHVYKLHHSIYLPSITSGTKCIITKKIIQNYFRQFTPSELFYTIIV
jgi:hypothetical protein